MILVLISRGMGSQQLFETREKRGRGVEWKFHFKEVSRLFSREQMASIYMLNGSSYSLALCFLSPTLVS